MEPCAEGQPGQHHSELKDRILRPQTACRFDALVWPTDARREQFAFPGPLKCVKRRSQADNSHGFAGLGAIASCACHGSMPNSHRWACHESDSSGRSTVGPIHWILRSHLRSRSGETDRRVLASSRSLLRSHRLTQFVRQSLPDWCRHFDVQSGWDLSDAANQIDAASVCRTGAGKTTSVSLIDRDHLPGGDDLLAIAVEI